MSDLTTEKLENLTIQDNNITTTTEFDPYSPGSPLDSQNEPQTVDLLGDLCQDQVTNGLDSVTVDPYTGQIDGPDKRQTKQFDAGLGRKMSEREVQGYQQNDYGGTFQSSAQMEYITDSDEDDKNNLVDTGAAAQPPMAREEQYYRSTGQPLIDIGGEPDSLSSDNQMYTPDSSQMHSEDILGSTDESLDMLSPGQNMDYIDPENWAPHIDPLHARRSRSPERSLSPPAHEEHMEEMQDDTKEASIPRSYGNEQDKMNLKDRKADKKVLHKIGHIPRPQGSPKVARAKKPLELPPWNDNVVIPKPPRMKPTLIGKQADTPPSPSRPKTAPSSLQYRKPESSSDSGVEEDKASRNDRKVSADGKKKYGTDTKNIKYKPGGGHVKIFTQKLDTTTVGPRTDSKPRALQSPRGSTPDRSPMSPKPPTPDVKNVHSKIGSLDNARHSPGGGNVKVVSAKVDFSNVSSKVGSKDKIDHKPKGGDKKIQSQKLNWNAESKVGSLKNASHSPSGGNVKILDQKVEVKAQSKIGSTANIKHKPGGGDKKIEVQKIDFTATAKSKVGSMDNVKHKPLGGDIKVRDEKVSWEASSKVGSLDNVKHVAGGGKIQVRDEKVSWEASSKVGSLDNVKHVAGGGKVKVRADKLSWEASSKCGSLDNVKHVAGGGKVQIYDEKLEFSEKVGSKVGSMEKVTHKPGGGDKKIETQKLAFKETAKARTDTGHGSGGEKKRSATSSRSDSIASQGSADTQ